MGKYLDGTGLAIVWNKIRSSFLPVKHVDQNEYDKLSDSEKNKPILYIVDSSGGSSNE